MSIFFTSDTHFGHENIITYCDRPFANVEEMNERLIENWNAVVKPDDTVYHIGDVFFGKTAHLLYRLNGKIHLVLGNHDEKIEAVTGKVFPTVEELALRARFESVQDYLQISVNKQRIVLFHYGLRTWHRDLRGTWHLYGHSHNKLEAFGKSVDVGVDNPLWNYAPVSFDQLKDFMDKREIGPHPQFNTYKEAKCPDCDNSKSHCQCGIDSPLNF